MGRLSGVAPVEPWKVASPRAKMPPPGAGGGDPLAEGGAGAPTMGGGGGAGAGEPRRGAGGRGGRADGGPGRGRGGEGGGGCLGSGWVGSRWGVSAPSHIRARDFPTRARSPPAWLVPAAQPQCSLARRRAGGASQQSAP